MMKRVVDYAISAAMVASWVYVFAHIVTYGSICLYEPRFGILIVEIIIVVLLFVYTISRLVKVIKENDDTG